MVKAIATIPPKLLRAILPSIVTITLADPEMPVFYTGSTVMDPGPAGNSFHTFENMSGNGGKNVRGLGSRRRANRPRSSILITCDAAKILHEWPVTGHRKLNVARMLMEDGWAS